MNIDGIKNGIVIDHITPGKAMQLYHMLGIDKLDCCVAVIQNVVSGKMGKFHWPQRKNRPAPGAEFRQKTLTFWG